VTGGSDLGLFEVNEAAEVVTGAADESANVIFGAVIDEGMAGRVRVTVIATGFDQRLRRERMDRLERMENEGQEQGARPAEGFDVPSDILEVPSFLRPR